MLVLPACKNFRILQKFIDLFLQFYDIQPINLHFLLLSLHIKWREEIVFFISRRRENFLWIMYIYKYFIPITKNTVETSLNLIFKVETSHKTGGINGTSPRHHRQRKKKNVTNDGFSMYKCEIDESQTHAATMQKE